MPAHTNRLAREASPYLLQHAHNPVDWFPWGEEALRRAEEEDKPILVSIGYAACHWCHVMERESFENEETAAIMNQHFINIKIDREERPDLDHIYMDALQAMSGQGGWPLNVFLLPNRQPFYGGTYFPPVQAYNRPSWTQVLESINDAYHNRRAELEEQARTLTEHLENSNKFGVEAVKNSLVPVNELFTREQCDTAAKAILAQGDKEWGGFGRAPKFPGTFSIRYLLQYHHAFGDEAAKKQALLSLDKMIQGGIYDQLGGGFSRYSTDEMWLAPHFEKMLYDNALLIDAMADAYQLTSNKTYLDTIVHTLEFIKREMTSPDGAFYAALDADSEGVEGKFYTWSKTEIEDILGDHAELFCRFYDVRDGGNWEHTNILWTPEPVTEFVAGTGLPIEQLEVILAGCRAKLLQERNKRVRPGLDDKILLGWNALLIHACCKAYSISNDPVYRDMAESAMNFVLKAMEQPGGSGALYHTYKNGAAKYPAFLDDYAYVIRALIALQEVTGNLFYIRRAKALATFVEAAFGDEEGIYFYYTATGQTDVIVRKKEIYDGAVPSGNAVMACNLLYLSIVFDEQSWANRATGMMSGLAQTAVRYPTSFGVWAALLMQLVLGTKELAVVGPEYAQRMNEINQRFIPFKVLLGSPRSEADMPLLQGREQENETLIYLCEHYSCVKPVKYISEIFNL
ncbi:thioredoxin domain-containing protein [Chitinophaga horti]|uniref:Thioredoxin domain-containing protein n=1 Tax=Chitinophaga horti TaxID=2920382 RepID=A0ABY6J067_9BACT|nr:thioredoxin domain-containing protein [Chitinophaga horti]UYQ93042.1 thioredoxin domain-containing protein [Chitinophaga horti]